VYGSSLKSTSWQPMACQPALGNYLAKSESPCDRCSNRRGSSPTPNFMLIHKWLPVGAMPIQQDRKFVLLVTTPPSVTSCAIEKDKTLRLLSFIGIDSPVTVTTSGNTVPPKSQSGSLAIRVGCHLTVHSWRRLPEAHLFQIHSSVLSPPLKPCQTSTYTGCLQESGSNNGPAYENCYLQRHSFTSSATEHDGALNWLAVSGGDSPFRVTTC